MTETSLNRRMMPVNHCFGCGQSNANGLHAEVFRDGDRTDRLLGRYIPPAHATGFPGIVHGGTIFAVLDCLSCWTTIVLHGDGTVLPLLRSGSVTYHAPAMGGQPIHLVGTIAEEPAPGKPVVVQAEARNDAGALLVDGTFRVAPIPAAKVKQLLGLAMLPADLAQIVRDPTAT